MTDDLWNRELANVPDNDQLLELGRMTWQAILLEEKVYALVEVVDDPGTTRTAATTMSRPRTACDVAYASSRWSPAIIRPARSADAQDQECTHPRGAQ